MDIPRRDNAVRSEWGTAVEIAEGLFRIRLNNPRGALMVNTYVYRDAGTYAVVDPGWPWSYELLVAALDELGLGPLRDVDHFLYTHTHIDHMGLAAELSHQFDAPHYCWSGVAHEIDAWHDFQDRQNDWSEWGVTALAGEARERARELYAGREEAAREERLVTIYGEKPVRNVVMLDWGDRLQIGDLSLEWVDARGHDPYHGALWEPELGWLFAGDAVLATPTPISRAMDDDLGLYRGTLDRLEALDASLLLPGHGVQRGGDLSRAFERSRAYVEAYATQVGEELQAASSPRGVYDIALSMTPDGKPYTPSARWWVHLALVDSHLNDAVVRGVVTRHDDPDGPRYELA